MTCRACEDRAGCAGEGKEMQHSFEELGLLDGNNHCGRKTRLKIATDCSDIVEGYNSSTTSCFMLILGHTKVDVGSRKWRLPFTAKGWFHFSLQCCINILLPKINQIASSTSHALLICESSNWHSGYHLFSKISHFEMKDKVTGAYIFNSAGTIERYWPVSWSSSKQYKSMNTCDTKCHPHVYIVSS